MRKYKKSFLVINILLGLVLLFLILNLLIFKNTSYLFSILVILIPFSIMVLLYGYEHKKLRFMYESIFYVASYSMMFLILTYLIGIYTGFSTNIYKLNFVNLTHNIIPYFILIFLSEMFRYEISRKGEGSNLSYILVTLIFIMIDMSLFLETYNLSIGDDQIKYGCMIVLPSIFKNVLLMYFSKIGGMVPSLIYRIMFDLKLVIVPIMPNFGLYFESIFNCILPVAMWLLMEVSLKKFKNREIDTPHKAHKATSKYVILIIIAGLTIMVNLLASGRFKYTLVSIGSGSMVPTIYKGDAVLYKRADTPPEVEDILVFKKEKKVVVHRIIRKVDIGNGEFVYYTKGDANEAEDGYPIEMKDILGVYKFKIRYIGMPSVMLGELLNR